MENITFDPENTLDNQKSDEITVTFVVEQCINSKPTATNTKNFIFTFLNYSNYPNLLNDITTAIEFVGDDKKLTSWKDPFMYLKKNSYSCKLTDQLLLKHRKTKITFEENGEIIETYPPPPLTRTTTKYILIDCNTVHENIENNTFPPKVFFEQLLYYSNHMSSREESENLLKFVNTLFSY